MVLRLQTSLPEEQLRDGEIDLSQNSEVVAKYADMLNEEVTGQAEAKAIFLDILEEIIAGVNIDTEWYDKPMASLFFSGPSGVGKTLLARVAQKILNQIFWENLTLVKINCADFRWDQWYNLTQLVWASAGFFDSNKKPRFHPDNIKWKGRVIIFDEIEKAWLPFWNLLLSVLDDGVLDINYSPGQKGQLGGLLGSTLSSNPPKVTPEEKAYLRTLFKDSLIILTSNVGNERIEQEIRPGIGFGSSGTPIELLNIEEIILEELAKTFKLELRGRFNYIVPFKHLTEKDVWNIVDILISRITKVFIEKEKWGMIYFDDRVKAFIIKDIFSRPDLRKYGGRFIENYFKKWINPKIAKLINGWWIQWKEYMVYVSEREWRITFSKIPFTDSVVSFSAAQVAKVILEGG